MLQQERKSLYLRIAQALVKNYDEMICLDEPEILLGLNQYNLPLPRILSSLARLEPEGLYVDELTAPFNDAKDGFGVELCLSKVFPNGDAVRIDTMDIEDIDDELLLRICEIAENHKI